MKKSELAHLIDVAAGRKPADLVLKNGKIVDVYQGTILTGDLAIVAGKIAGIGEIYEGKEVIDVKGKYIAPGFIDPHIHVESSYVTPEEFGRLLVPHGTTTVMADPHEIVKTYGVRHSIHAPLLCAGNEYGECRSGINGFGYGGTTRGRTG